MAKKFDEKLKILHILKILTEETDSERRIFVPEIISRLQKLGIEAERKSVYRDLDTLAAFGYDILHDRTGCALVSREFELAELKLLVDAVQASRFITGENRKKLIGKLSRLTSRHEAKLLNRSVHTDEGERSVNRSIIENIDWIHAAMGENKKISFQYFDWTPSKEQHLRHDGKRYEMSPWSLIWSNENYYMLAYDEKLDNLRHFRVDKMKNIRKQEALREGFDIYSRFDFSKYSSKLFGMFSGEECSVTLKCENGVAGSIIDRFGTSISIFPQSDGYFTCVVPVIVSPNFYSWVLQFGKRIEICAPADIREGMKNLLFGVGELYK